MSCFTSRPSPRLAAFLATPSLRSLPFLTILLPNTVLSSDSLFLFPQSLLPSIPFYTLDSLTLPGVRCIFFYLYFFFPIQFSSRGKGRENEGVINSTCPRGNNSCMGGRGMRFWVTLKITEYPSMPSTMPAGVENVMDSYRIESEGGKKYSPRLTSRGSLFFNFLPLS